MSTPEWFTPRRTTRPFLHWALLLALMLAAVPATAQEGEGAPTLLERLEETFRVLPSSDGYTLLPKDEGSDIQLVEVEDGTVSLDGEPASPSELEDHFGSTAELLLALAEGRDLDEIETTEEELDEGEREERRERRIRHQDTRMAFGNSLTIQENESPREVVVLGGSLEVLGEVRGDVVVIGGSVVVKGVVEGDLTAIGGPIELGPGTRVEGEVVSIGGQVSRDSTADIGRGVTELAFGPNVFLGSIPWGSPDFWWPGSWFSFGWNNTFDLIGNAIFLGFLLMLVVFLARRPVERVAEHSRHQPWKSAAIGLLVQILFLPVVFLLFILLIISLVGIPLALLLLPMSLVVLALFLLLGYAGVARVAGSWIQDNFQLQALGVPVAVLFGLLLIQCWSIFGEALNVFGGPIRLAAWLFILFGFLVKYLVWTTGLGAAVIYAFSSSPPPAPMSPALTPPPSPPGNDMEAWSISGIDASEFDLPPEQLESQAPPAQDSASSDSENARTQDDQESPSDEAKKD